jgi:hypothetical protein
MTPIAVSDNDSDLRFKTRDELNAIVAAPANTEAERRRKSRARSRLWHLNQRDSHVQSPTEAEMPVDTPATSGMLPVSITDDDDDSPAENATSVLIPNKTARHEALAFKADEQSNAAEIEARLRKLARESSLLAVVPEKNRAFVPFGKFDVVERVIASRQFCGLFVVGLSGNGKTMFPEQACAKHRREHIQVDITSETDEDDLIGGFRLRNGETYFELGPVPVAMIRGAVLVFNELDLASNKIMCLQSVVDGKPLTIKKLGIVIKPTPGFTVIATANTKGRGDEAGKFVGTGYLNEAFLERFPITIEQEYPPEKIEKVILEKSFVSFGGTVTPQATQFFDTLAKWAKGIRDTYKESGIDDVISTRRLVHIIRTYVIFGATQEAQAQSLDLCIARFDQKTADAMFELWNKLVPDPSAPTNVGTVGGKAPFA